MLVAGSQSMTRFTTTPCVLILKYSIVLRYIKFKVNNNHYHNSIYDEKQISQASAVQSKQKEMLGAWCLYHLLCIAKEGQNELHIAQERSKSAPISNTPTNCLRVRAQI